MLNNNIGAVLSILEHALWSVDGVAKSPGDEGVDGPQSTRVDFLHDIGPVFDRFTNKWERA